MVLDIKNDWVTIKVDGFEIVGNSTNRSGNLIENILDSLILVINENKSSAVSIDMEPGDVSLLFLNGVDDQGVYLFDRDRFFNKNSEITKLKISIPDFAFDSVNTLEPQLKKFCTDVNDKFHKELETRLKLKIHQLKRN